MEVASDDVESPPKRRKVGDGTPQTSAPSPPELVTVEDSSSDEAPEEKEEGRGEGGNVMQQDAKDARAGGEGERREKDGEWCKQSPVTDWRSYDGERGDKKEGGVSTGAKSMFGTIPEFGADAVMIGSHVVASPCHMKINMGSWVTVALKIEDEDAKDTTLDIPEGDITFFGVRYEKEKHLRQEQKLSRCKDTSMAKDKDEGDGVEAEDGKRDIGIKPAPLPEPASGISRHGTRATVKIATKASTVLVSATAPAPALNQASSAAHDLAGVEGREGLVEPARAATAAAAVIASTHFSCVQTSGEAVVHAGEETSSLSRKGSVRDWGKEECASDSIDNDSNNRCNPATAAARRRRKTLETKETPGGGAKNDGGGDGDGVEEAAGEGAASSAPSRGETDDVARGGSGRTFNGMKAARRRKNATGKESSDRLAAAVASDAVGSGIASRSSSTTTTNNSVDDNVKGDREDTCSSILASKPSVGERELMDPSVSGVAGTVEDGDHAIYRSSVAARAGKEKGEEARHEDEEEGRQEPAEDGSLQTLDGIDLEDDGIEREQGTRAPIRRKKKLQPDLTTGRALTATVLADGSVAGEMPTNKEDGCRRKKVKDAGRKGAEAEYSSVHNSEDKGPGEVVPISVGADAATNRPACTGTLDAEESEGDGRRARNEGGQLGKGAKARSLEIEYSSVQQPDDEGSVGAEAASDLFKHLSAIAQMTSPIRRRRNARSPTRDVGNATGGENNALAAQEEGVMKAFHASRKVPATPSSRQMLKGSPSPEQRVAQMLRLADDADLHEAMVRSTSVDDNAK